MTLELHRIARRAAVLIVALQSAALARVGLQAQPAELVARFPCADAAVSAVETLEIREQGLYRLRIEGRGGSRAVVIDKMYGAIGAAAIPLDPAEPPASFAGFLEAGLYELRLSKKAGEAAAMAVERFRELGTAERAPDARWAAELGLFRDFQLGEGQLRYFQVSVGADLPRLDFLAVGRSLGGMALFRSGGWDTGLRPYSGRVEAEKGKPLTYFGYSLEVEPGDYLVACWGAPPLPWKETGPEAGLYVMEGARRLDSIGLHELVLGGAGIDCVAVPSDADFVQASIRNEGDLLLSAAPLDSDRFSASAVPTDKRGGYRTATLRARGGGGWQWIVVRGKPGQRVELRHFRTAPSDSSVADAGNEGPGQFAMRFLGSVEGEDSGPLTALVGQMRGGGRRLAAISLSAAKSFRLTSNLLDWMGYILQVEEPGKYAVLERGQNAARGVWTFYPLVGSSFDRYGVQTARAGKSVPLEAGAYAMIVRPERQGQLDALVARESAETLAGGLGLWNRSPDAGSNAAAWYDLSVGRDDRLGVFIGNRPGSSQGYALRSLPARMEDPLAFRLGPGETASVDILLELPSLIRLSGGVAKLQIDGKAWSEATLYSAGTHRLSATGSAGSETWATVEAVARQRVPPPELLPFEEGKPLWADFKAGETKRCVLQVPASAVYQVETAGRLATSISIRSPLATSLARDEGSGTGRNSRVSAYLKPGKYLVEVSALAPSKGRAGVTISKSRIRGLAPLSPGGIVRTTLDAGEAASLEVRVEAAGTYMLAAVGLGRDFEYRLEDAGGWPVAEPRGRGTAILELAAGKYRYVSLADEVPTRRLFTLSAPAGSGPGDERPAGKRFDARLDAPYSLTWKGPGPDEAVVDLPASVDLWLSLSDSMSFIAAGPDGAVIEAGLGANDLRLRLPAGRTVLSFSPIIPDEDHAYSFGLRCGTLMEGRPLFVEPGAALPIAVGREGFWELSTSGPQEIGFTLYEQGPSGLRFLAESEEIPDDWNARIGLRLKPGAYLARFSAPDGSGAAFFGVPGPEQAAGRDSDDRAMGDSGGGAYEEGYYEEPPFDEAEYGEAAYEEGVYEEEYYEEEYAEGPYDEEYEGPYDEGGEYGADGGYGPEAGLDSAASAVAGLSSGYGSSRAELRFREDLAAGSFRGDFSAAAEIGPEVAVFSFTPTAAGPHAFVLESPDPAQMVLERGGAVVARGSGVLRVPLEAGAAYAMRCARSEGGRATVRLSCRALSSGAAQIGGAGEIRSGAEAVRLSDPAGPSRSLATAGLLVSRGIDGAFAPDDGSPFLADGAWIARADGGPLGTAIARPAALSPESRSLALTLGATGQRVKAAVPEGFAALLRLEARGVAASLTEEGDSAPKVDWLAASIDQRGTLLGLAAGERSVMVRDTAVGADRRVALSLDLLYLSETRGLGGGASISFPVRGGEAVAVRPPPGGATLVLSMEKGLAAFAAGDRTRRTLSAEESSSTFSVDLTEGTLYIANAGTGSGLASVSARPLRAAEDPVVAEGAAYESIVASDGLLELRVEGGGPGRSILVAGSIGGCRFLDADTGLISVGEARSGAAGPFVEFRGARGRLEIEARRGWLHAWVGDPSSAAGDLYRGGAKAAVPQAQPRQAAAPAAFALSGEGESRFALGAPADGILSVKATGPGLLALLGADGEPLAVSGGAAEQEILYPARAGSYLVAARPFAGAARSGALSLALSPPIPVAGSGEGEPALLGPGDRAVYRFSVRVAGAIGVGLRSETDALAVRVCDDRMRVLAEGPVVARRMEPGDYYLVVEAADRTVRYAPIFVGLEGSRVGAPDEVVSSYLNDGE